MKQPPRISPTAYSLIVIPSCSKDYVDGMSVDFDEAEELFDQCFKMSGKNEYLDARVRIQKRKKEKQSAKQSVNQTKSLNVHSNNIK